MISGRCCFRVPPIPRFWSRSPIATTSRRTMPSFKPWLPGAKTGTRRGQPVYNLLSQLAGEHNRFCVPMHGKQASCSALHSSAVIRLPRSLGIISMRLNMVLQTPTARIRHPLAVLLLSSSVAFGPTVGSAQSRLQAETPARLNRQPRHKRRANPIRSAPMISCR